MTNLSERLDKHLQNIREDKRISPKELYELIKSHKNELTKLGDKMDKIYKQYLDSNYIVNNPLKEGPSLYMFGDSYVGGEEYDFIAYCLCSYLGVDSGIDINAAYKQIEKLVKIGEDEYKREIKWNNLLKWFKDEHIPIENQRKILKDYEEINVSPREVIVMGDDSGDEYNNPLWFTVGLEVFAKECKALELANKLKPLVKRASWLLDRLELL